MFKDKDLQNLLEKPFQNLKTELDHYDNNVQNNVQTSLDGIFYFKNVIINLVPDSYSILEVKIENLEDNSLEP